MAESEVEKAGVELSIEPDALAVVVRDGDGCYRVQTNHHVVGSGAGWGMAWVPLFGVLFFAPVLGMAVGTGLGGLMRQVARIGIDEDFRRQVREMLQPGGSALFMVVAKVPPATAVGALDRYGGTVLSSRLSEYAEHELQEQLHGGVRLRAEI